MQIVSNTMHNLPKLPVQLTDIIFVPGLDKSLLSVGWMTSAGVNIQFEQSDSMLVYNRNVVAHGSKVGNSYTYMSQRWNRERNRQEPASDTTYPIHGCPTIH